MFCDAFLLVSYIGSVATLQDTPGFIVNRLLLPYLAEAVMMLERGTYGVIKLTDSL